MRFKAKLCPEQVQLLYQLVGPLSKLSGSGVERSNASSNNTSNSNWISKQNCCLLRLDDAHLQLSVAGRTLDSDGMTCFAELSSTNETGNSIFLEKVLESAAPHNAIVLEVDLVQFVWRSSRCSGVVVVAPTQVQGVVPRTAICS